MEIKVLKTDITQLHVDTIVNAANSTLLGGGGVDGAIHRAGGPRILEECKAIVDRQGMLPTGECVLTTGGNLPANFVIHTVGPVWFGGENEEPLLLRNCYQYSLELAEEKGFQRIAFPNISTGVYQYPKEAAAKIAWHTVQNFKSHHLREIIFACFNEDNFKIYQDLLSRNTPSL